MTFKGASGLVGMLCSVALTGAIAEPPPTGPSIARVLASVELSRPFEAPAGWRFLAVQGANVPDPFGEISDTVPGVLRLCISRDSGRTCQPGLERLLASRVPGDLFTQPHYLNDARVLHPRPDIAVLLIQVASLRGGNGDQRVATIALRYDRARAGFVPVYEKQTRRNNNQEIRYIEHGRLSGAIVSAEPTHDAPFGFWMTVNRLGPDTRYRPVLRYRSATRYGDGNTLAVINSEMPNMLRRLDLWRPGAALPLPTGRCAKPQLIEQELWCSPRPAAR